MKIICLFAQRKCSYPGQHAPELYASADDITDEDNPEYLLDEEHELRNDEDIQFYKRIVVEISDEEFKAAFNQEPPAIHGTINTNQHNTEN
jgi:hypothetical protein